MFSVFPRQAILQNFLNLRSWQHQNNNSKMSQSDKAILWGQVSFKNEMFCIPCATYFIVCYICYLYFNTISVYLINPLWYCGFQIQLVTFCFVYLFYFWLSTYSEQMAIITVVSFFFSVFPFFSFFWCFFFKLFLCIFCFFFCILICFFLGVAFLFYIFSHFFANKLIFTFIGFWLTGYHYTHMQLQGQGPGLYIYIYLTPRTESWTIYTYVTSRTRS